MGHERKSSCLAAQGSCSYFHEIRVRVKFFRVKFNDKTLAGVFPAGTDALYEKPLNF